MDLYIIDAIGPFFIDYQKRVVNWSKIPFVNLEDGNRLDQQKLARIQPAFETFLERILELGFNAISIDDVAHLVCFDFYSESLKSKLKEYEPFFLSLFQLARKKGIRIYVNTDIMFSNPEIRKEVGRGLGSNIRFLQDTLKNLFDTYPVDGVIFRIGECDGEDVIGDFNSSLLIKTPRAANRLIKELLPTFEDYDKQLIFRTWTVGSYPIGDLIWNPDTFNEAFEGINSPYFIVSLKYGDTDFFSSLELNPLFYMPKHKTILELQTRRERECFGALPYYVGWDYETYYRKLKSVKELVGVSVWCQTGGWSRNNELTFLHNGSAWNELNTFASIRIFKDNWTADQAADRFFSGTRIPQFLKRFHDLFFRILYPSYFARKSLFFRRTRIPPLVWLSWDYISVNSLMISLYRAYNKKNELVGVTEQEIEEVRLLGKELDIDRIDFYCDTLTVFLSCSRAVQDGYPIDKLLADIDRYKSNYPGCNLKFKISENSDENKTIKRLVPILLRETSDYRLIDRIMLNRFFSQVQLFFMLRLSRDQLPKYANKRAMRPEVLFK